jgi:two-component system, cell cycle sensor histidine kinase and response regulator CckA
VVMNLVINSRDAMPEGGRLTVRIDEVELDETAALAFVEGRSGHYARLSVTDTGIGMDERTRARLFEPFFTTKEQGKGTGLGLSIVYGIVKQSGGYVTVTSERGRGTTFQIYLPIAVAREPAASLV